MYAKIFESIYDGSLRKDWKALIVFQQFLILCDEEGHIDMTPDAISSRTTIPIEIVEHGIKELEAPDPDSRSRNEEGRRIVLVNPPRKWGWKIVNHKAYREIKTKADLRDYWSDKKRESRTLKAQNNTFALKEIISNLYRRKDTDAWSYLEESQLCEIARRPNVMEEIEELKKLRVKDPQYFPKSIDRLLSSWTATLDRSRIPATQKRSNSPNI